MPSSPDRGGLLLVRLILVIIAVLLVVAHFVLDAGAGREAPRWLLYGAIIAALAGFVLGLISRSNRR